MESRGKRIYHKGGNGYRTEASLRNRHNPRKTAPKYIWPPCIPFWEREFTSKIGNIKWEDFVENKKETSFHSNIMEWNDSSCEEAFKAAKKRFQDEYNGYKSEVLLPDPDMHIQKNINWNLKPEENNEDVEPMLSISDAEENLLENEVMHQMPEMLSEIGPTGWDVDVSETPRLLTGWIVGDKD